METHCDKQRLHLVWSTERGHHPTELSSQVARKATENNCLKQTTRRKSIRHLEATGHTELSNQKFHKCCPATFP